MKKLLKSIYQLLEAIGQARAASHFARQGNFEAARKTIGVK
jgi:hypothetical protein